MSHEKELEETSPEKELKELSEEELKDLKKLSKRELQNVAAVYTARFNELLEKFQKYADLRKEYLQRCSHEGKIYLFDAEKNLVVIASSSTGVMPDMPDMPPIEKMPTGNPEKLSGTQLLNFAGHCRRVFRNLESSYQQISEKYGELLTKYNQLVVHKTALCMDHHDASSPNGSDDEDAESVSSSGDGPAGGGYNNPLLLEVLDNLPSPSK